MANGRKRFDPFAGYPKILRTPGTLEDVPPRMSVLEQMHALAIVAKAKRTAEYSALPMRSQLANDRYCSILRAVTASGTPATFTVGFVSDALPSLTNVTQLLANMRRAGLIELAFYTAVGGKVGHYRVTSKGLHFLACWATYRESQEAAPETL